MLFAGPWEEWFYTLLLIGARLSAFWAVLPVLRRGVPNLAKAGIVGLFALLLTPVVAPAALPASLGFFVVQVARETFVGLLLGFLVALVFSALYMAGQLIDIPMGFGMVTLFDSQTGDHVPMLGQFQNALAVLLFFSLNGHHALLAAMAQSFTVVPLGQGALAGGVVQSVFQAFASLFVISLRIALPVMAAILVIDIALGIVTRAVPQMNVFVIGFPVKIAVGLFIYLLSLPLIVTIIARLVSPSGNMMVILQDALRQLGVAGL